MEFAIFWVGFAVAIGIWASNKGRNGFGWFLLALIISPLLAGVFCAVASSKDKGAAAGAPTEDSHVKCPACAEFVLPQAKICKHCGQQLTPQPDYVEVRATTKSKEDRKNLLIGLGTLIALFAVAAFIANF